MENPIDVHALDQGTAEITRHLIPHYAAVYRAFLEEEGIDAAIALQLTGAYMNSMRRPAP